MDAFVLTDAERRFLAELDARGVRYMMVGLTAAALQGANSTSVDIDLWFESLADERIGDAARASGGFWATRMAPPMLGGSLGDRFDVVLSMSGLGSFADEYRHTHPMTVEGVPIRVLDLARIIASKRAANRPKDAAVLPTLEEALAARDALSDDDETT